MVMRRRRKIKKSNKFLYKTLIKLVYALCVSCIIAGSVYVYMMWYRRYSAARPPLASAEGGFYLDETPFKAVLLWQEKVLFSPAEGKVFYPKGIGPLFVGVNETLAVIESKDTDKRFYIKAKKPGYFIAGLDGYEGQWNYINLWNNAGISVNRKLKLIKNGSSVMKGMPVGKLIPQPQQLRAIAYIGSLPALEDMVKDRKISIKMEKSSFAFDADIEAISQTGSLRKIYLVLPFFPLEIVRSREINLILCMGEKRGVVIPESAVLMQGGKLWVYRVEGDEVVKRKVMGLPLGKGKFMVTEGLKPGEVVVKNASKAREGVIKLW